MKEPKQTKRSAAAHSLGKTLKPTQPVIKLPAKAVSNEAPKSQSLDPQRQEIVYDDRGEPYVRLTPLGSLELAEREPDQREVADYIETIRTLRRKGFSFREIAEWFTEQNIHADHNAVYRIYTKLMTLEDAEMEARMKEEDSRG
jgi:hypothetical protein